MLFSSPPARKVATHLPLSVLVIIIISTSYCRSIDGRCVHLDRNGDSMTYSQGALFHLRLIIDSAQS